MLIALIIGLCLASYLLGAHLGLPNKKYFGHISVQQKSTGVKTYILEVNGDPEMIEQKKKVMFSVGSAYSVDE